MFLYPFFCLKARVLAVLDWELSTTGQPLTDLAYFLMPHYCPSHLNIITVLGGVTVTKGGSSLLCLLCFPLFQTFHSDFHLVAHNRWPLTQGEEGITRNYSFFKEI